jgi:hypothetical protein
MEPQRRTKGHRYIRVSDNRKSWALWEHDGERYRRVGTARTVEEYIRFLFNNADEITIQHYLEFERSHP